jgi:hypothetical protein
MAGSPLPRIYELVGESTTRWNQVEELWYLIFTALMHEADRAKVDVIYDVFHAGALQRQLIMAVAAVALKFDVREARRRNPEHRLRRCLLRRLGQLHARTNALAGRRNAVVHSAFELGGGLGNPWQTVAIGPHKRSKIADEDHLPYLIHLTEDATLLAYDLADLRDLFLDWLEPGARERRNELLRQQGLLSPADARKEARDKILQAVAARTPPPPPPSEA